MAKIERLPSGMIKVSVNLYYQEIEFQSLEDFRKRSEDRLREKGYLGDNKFTLDDAIFYIVGEVLDERYFTCAFDDD